MSKPFNEYEFVKLSYSHKSGAVYCIDIEGVTAKEYSTPLKAAKAVDLWHIHRGLKAPNGLFKPKK